MYLSEEEKQDQCNWIEYMMTFEELERINEIFSDVPQLQIDIAGISPKPGVGYDRKGFKAAFQRQALAFIDTLFDFDMDKCMEDM